MKSTSLEIIALLKKHGHEAYWAGGCVRDMLLGIKPKDFDIVTSALPNQIEEILEHTIPIGKEFGVILSVKNGHNFEIATFRSDSGYSDGRRPDAVLFTNAEEDAKRRDFTINGLFYDPTTDKILDYVDGQTDLRDRLVRFIGDPDTRIKEDHLRILRAIRIKNNYNFQYHPETYRALKEHAHLVKNVSTERIRDELNKMITGKNPAQSFEELYELGILEEIIPELARLKGLAQPLQYHQEGDVWDHSLNTLKALNDEESGADPLSPYAPSLALTWACLMHDIGKYETFGQDHNRIRYDRHAESGAETAKKVLKRLNFPWHVINRVHWLIAHHMMVVPLLEMPTGRRRHWFLQPGFEELLEVYRCDSMGTLPVDLTLYHKVLKKYRNEIAKLRLMPPKLLTGEQVMEILTLKPGKEVGEILDQIRDLQLSEKLKTPADAIKWLKTR